MACQPCARRKAAAAAARAERRANGGSGGYCVVDGDGATHRFAVFYEARVFARKYGYPAPTLCPD